MRFVFDIDGTICKVTDDYENFHKIDQHKHMVDLINDLYDNGHYIIISTARGMISSNSVIAKAYNKWYSKTEAQLKSWNLKYHELHMGKPYADMYIDDKAFGVNPDGSSVGELKQLIANKLAQGKN